MSVASQKQLRSIARRKDLARSLKSAPCADCGIQYPWYVMQFDHVRGKKLGHVTQMPILNWSLEKFLAEVEKCDVVCANCHAQRTAERGGWA